MIFSNERQWAFASDKAPPASFILGRLRRRLNLICHEYINISPSRLKWKGSLISPLPAPRRRRASADLIMKSFLCVCALTAGLGGVLLGVGFAAARRDPLTLYWLVFTSYRDGNAEIYRMNPDGSALERLTHHPAADTSPIGMPDGRHVLFVSLRVQGEDIFQVDMWTHRVTLVLRTNAADYDPAISPASDYLAFVSYRDYNAEIYRMHLPSQTTVRLTFDRGNDSGPVWSPDGQWLAFASNRDDNTEIYMMRADGSALRRVTTYADTDFTPQWSADGTRLLFIAHDNQGWGIFEIGLDGNNRTRLTGGRGNYFHPVFSPDGSKIAFSSSINGNSEIFVMNADGTDVRRLTHHPMGDDSPAWVALPQKAWQPARHYITGALLTIAAGLGVYRRWGRHGTTQQN